MATAPPRVKLITIDGLFRQYNHVIPLRLDERVTVLHGRNGVGKTVTLRLVAALLRGEYTTLATVPFERLRVDLTDGSFLNVRVEEKAQENTIGQELRQRPFVLEYRLGAEARKVVQLWTAREMTPQLELDVFAEANRRRPDAAKQVGHDSLPPIAVASERLEVRAFLRNLPVRFIEAQRLFRFVSVDQDGTGTNLTVTMAMADIAADMATRVRLADSTYRSTSTRLDDSLPARLFAPPKNGAKVPKKELNQRSEALEAERRRLHAIGLLPDTTAFNPSTLTESQRAMFIVYLKDNEEKLAVFKDLADRAEILLSTLNRKLAPKSIKLDKDVGYKVLSHDGRPLDLDVLSSGEQHELVLLHTLLFRVEPGAFLLIDEPELSLHVTWQNEFLAELIQIAKKVGFDALVATHSPYIVGERRDLMVRLGEPV